MNLLIVILIVFPALVSIIRSILELVYLWQVKEYRFDRVLSQLRYETNYWTRSYFVYYFKAILGIPLLVYLFDPIYDWLLISAVPLFLVYLLEFEYFLKQLLKKNYKRPKLKSVRNVIILSWILVCLGLIFLGYFLWLRQFPDLVIGESTVLIDPDSSSMFNGLIDGFRTTTQDNLPLIPLASILVATALSLTMLIDLFLPVLVFVGVMFTEPLARYSRNRIINQAKKLLQQNPKIKIIAITGSYGKSTTKEYLAEILAHKYKVAKTIANHNTEVGIAISILKNLGQDTEILVAEMGAYVPGEIARAAKLAQPDISIVTAISDQHLSLFGSRENLISAKAEIAEGLKTGGVLVANAEDEGCLQIANKYQGKKLYYHLLEHKPEKAKPEDLYAYGFKQVKTGHNFMLLYQNKELKVSSKIVVREFTSNLLAAISAAILSGIQYENIPAIVERMQYETNYFVKKKAINNSWVLDDSKTSNSQGFKIAINQLLQNEVPGRRWIISQGIIELGSQRDKVYRELAKVINENSIGLLTTDKDFAEIVKDDKSGHRVLLLNNISELRNYYNANIKQGDLVLIEGSIPDQAFKEILINAS